MLTYDFPLSSKSRIYLKFETLFKRIENCKNLDSEAEILCITRGVIDFMDMLDGSGTIKIEILKDIDRMDGKFKQWEQDPEVNTALIKDLRKQLAAARSTIDQFTRQRTVLKDDLILESIKPRFLTPCGVNNFDTPLFLFWQNLPKTEKLETISKWLHELDILRTPITTILKMWRLCSEPQKRIAKKGFMQESGDNCEFIEIKYPKTVRAYPVVSGFQSSINVRFIPYDKGQRCGDIEFELTFIKGALL